jgi:SAM-dependent methyltransferase
MVKPDTTTPRPLPERVRARLRRLLARPVRRLTRPAWLHLLLRRVRPLSASVGIDRGTPVDRYFIERFLDRNRERVRGRVLEIKDGDYTARFGGSRVTRGDILDINTENPLATILSDLRGLPGVPDDTYDCFIVTQVLQYVDDLDAAVRSARRVLKPGGCLLVTAPTLGKLDGQADRVAGHYWRLTPDSARLVFERHFPAEDLEIQGWGNVLVGTGMLHGLCAEEIPRRKLETYDPFFTCGVTIRAVKK